MPTSNDYPTNPTLQDDELELVALLSTFPESSNRAAIIKIVGRIAGERQLLQESLQRLHQRLLDTVPDVTLTVSLLKFELNATRMERDKYKALLHKHGISEEE